MADYQGRTNGGSGFLRIMEFSPSNNVIRVKTYSPTFNQFESDADSEFTLDYDMRSGTAFTALASFTSISCATNLTTTWAGLVPSAKYEWCVVVNDGNTVQTSPIWQFTAGLAQQVSVPFAATLSFDRAAQTLSLSWPTISGVFYQVVYRDNIADPSWAAFTSPMLANDEVLTFSIPVDPRVPHRFFGLRRIN
jgi:hypothetical protein